MSFSSKKPKTSIGEQNVKLIRQPFNFRFLPVKAISKSSGYPSPGIQGLFYSIIFSGNKTFIIKGIKKVVDIKCNGGFIFPDILTYTQIYSNLWIGTYLPALPCAPVINIFLKAPLSYFDCRIKAGYKSIVAYIKNTYLLKSIVI